jgi:hypothetical protein
MTLLDDLAVRNRIVLAEEAVSRLLAGIETGAAVGKPAAAYRAALQRHGATILEKNGGPEALAAATDRLSAISGREADRRAVLDRLWSDLQGIRE